MLLLSSLLLGCAASKPPQNVGFGRVVSIRGLAGSYVNLGESGKDVRWYLSAVIWPDSAGTNLGARGIDHAGIVTIEVSPIGDTALHVRALREDGLEKEQTFVEGKDFRLHSGRLVLGHRTESTMKPEVPVLGVMQTTRELGLDEGGPGQVPGGRKSRRPGLPRDAHRGAPELGGAVPAEAGTGEVDCYCGASRISLSRADSIRDQSRWNGMNRCPGHGRARSKA